MTNTQKRLVKLWKEVRKEINPNERYAKLGTPRKQYLTILAEEEITDDEYREAMRNFMTDAWWSDKEHKAYQDLEHFIRNYSKFLPGNYRPSKVSTLHQVEY